MDAFIISTGSTTAFSCRLFVDRSIEELALRSRVTPRARVALAMFGRHVLGGEDIECTQKATQGAQGGVHSVPQPVPTNTPEARKPRLGRGTLTSSRTVKLVWRT